MFENLKDPNFSIGINPKKEKKYESEKPIEGNLDQNKNIIIGVLVLFLISGVLVFSVAGFLYFKKISADKKEVHEPIKNSATSSIDQERLVTGNDTSTSTSSDIGNIKIESVSFGSLYAANQENVSVNENKISLPLSVKTEVSNYYDISRKIEIDQAIEGLNENGFAFIDNPFDASTVDFFSAYDALTEKNIQQLVTDDFLIYYYQNKIKNIYSDIQTKVFYKEFWEINKNFFMIADARYRKTRLDLGNVNDQLMEGQRLEAAFFAVSLELLKPKDEQFTGSGTSAIEDKFNTKEARAYDFNIPEYLKEDVTREVALIEYANRTEKSPVLLYQRDYKSFKSDISTKNAKLYNFALATKWFNSVFPAYFINDSCSNCLLDQNDWLINNITAQYIAKDFLDNPELKTRWARIYKVISYFSGLRKDLTYINYAQVVTDLNGNDYKLEEMFSQDKNVDEKLQAMESIRDEVVKRYNFSSLAGGLDRQLASDLPFVGMRMLQDKFWPDDYIFSRFITPAIANYTGALDLKKNREINTTSCPDKKEYTRCKPLALDVINVIYPIEGDDFFIENTSYEGYENNISDLRSQLNAFNIDDWHENVYWNTLGIIGQSELRANSYDGPINMTNGQWMKKRINTSLGAWVNLRLPADIFTTVKKQSAGGLSSSGSADAYVEPNLKLINDLISNIGMLEKMFEILGISKEIDYTIKDFSIFKKELEAVRLIIIKELNNIELDSIDQLALNSFTRRYTGIEIGNKKSISFKYSSKGSIIQSIDGIKFMISVYQLPDKKILTVGPVFNYRDGK